MFTGCKTTEDLFTHTLSSTNSSPQGTSVTAWDNGQQVKKTNVYNKAYQLQFTTENPTETLDSITGEKQDHVDFLIKNYSVTDQKTLGINLTPVQQGYQHSLTINLKSDEAGEGKIVRDSPITLTNSQGTRTLNTSGQTITYSWTSNQETENITYDINPSGTGHQDLPAKQASVGASKTID